VHILSFSAGPSPGYPRVLSNCFRVFFLSLLIAVFFASPFHFPKVPVAGSSCCITVVDVFLFAGVACVGVVVNVS